MKFTKMAKSNHYKKLKTVALFIGVFILLGICGILYMYAPRPALQTSSDVKRVQDITALNYPILSGTASSYRIRGTGAPLDLDPLYEYIAYVEVSPKDMLSI